MTGYQAFVLYVALKAHFNSSYDYFKYQGKIKSASRQLYDDRSDKYIFERLAKHKDPQKFLVANLIEDNKFWAGLINSDNSKNLYTEWMKRNQSLQYTFQQSVGPLFEKSDNLWNTFRVGSDEHPDVIQMYLNRAISIEVLIILCDCLSVIKYWDKAMETDVIWKSQVSPLINNYQPFLTYDRAAYRKILSKFVQNKHE